MPLPSPRGPLSEALLRTVSGADDPGMLVTRSARVSTADDLLTDDDAQLALYLMYELHYGGLGPDADVLEWHPDVLAARAHLERRLEAALRQACPVQPCAPRELPRRLFDLAAGSSAPGTPSVPGFLARQATVTQVAEQLVLRSPYQLKEGDPHTWAIPRLRGRAKAALVEVQADEYGGGRQERMHSALFASMMRDLGLDDTPGGYVDDVPAATLASTNTVMMFGLHRRLRGAVAGHLAALEMTSSLPNRRYGNGLRRLGFGPETT